MEGNERSDCRKNGGNDLECLYIVIPAYNEQETIRDVIKEWYPIVERYNGNGTSRLVIIDDGSKDHTYKIMEEEARSKPYFQPVTKTNGGHGATVLFGYHYALDHQADYIFQTDSDGQTLASEFPPFWEERGQYDMVIGYRNHREDGFSRVVVTKTLKLVIRLIFHAWVTDANTPYRLMKATTLGRYLPIIPEDFNLSNVVLSVIYKKKNCAVKFVPITFRPRQGGVNSINLKRIIGIGKRALKDFRGINRRIDKAGF